MRKKNFMMWFSRAALLSVLMFQMFFWEEKVAFASVVEQGDAKIKIENCIINPQDIKPGGVFSVDVKIQNSSQSMDIKNMRLNYSNADGILTPIGNLGTVYLDSLSAGQSGMVHFEMKVSGEVTNYNQKITLDIQYEDKNGNSYTYTDYIYLTIKHDSNVPKSNLFEIESDHTFVDMDSSYKNGYTPKVVNGSAHIVMPLWFVGDGSIYGNAITASIQYADLQNSPYKIKSYSKMINPRSYDSIEGDKLTLYMADFTLDLNKDRKNGVYPVDINIQYELNSVVKEQTFTVYIVIQDGKSLNASADNPKPVAKFIVTSCITNPKNPHTGDTVTFQVSLKNTNKGLDINNIKLNYSSDTGDMIPEQDSSCIYIDKIRAGETKKISFKMKILNEISTQNQKLTLTISGEDENGTAVSDTENLYSFVELPFGMKIEKPVLASEMESGKTKTISFPIMNIGKTKIRNIICVLKMEGVISSGAYFLGELDPADSKQASLRAVIANKKITDPTISENDKYGPVTGTITVTYEDLSGKSYKEVIDVNSSITKPHKEQVKKAEINSQWWISIIIGLIIIQVIISMTLFYKKKRSVA